MPKHSSPRILRPFGTRPRPFVLCSQTRYMRVSNVSGHVGSFVHISFAVAVYVLSYLLRCLKLSWCSHGGKIEALVSCLRALETSQVNTPSASRVMRKA
jgi:hypothetical protein